MNPLWNYCGKPLEFSFWSVEFSIYLVEFLYFYVELLLCCVEFLEKHIMAISNTKEYQSMVVALMAILFGEYSVKSEVVGRLGRCDVLSSPKKQIHWVSSSSLKA